MKIKTGNLPLNTIEALKELSSKSKILKGSVSYKIFKFIKTISEELEDLSKVEKEIIEEYCIKDEEGNPIPKDGQYDFTDEVKLILNEKILDMRNSTEEIDFDVVPEIDSEMLDQLELTFDTMAFLDYIEKIKM